MVNIKNLDLADISSLIDGELHTENPNLLKEQANQIIDKILADGELQQAWKDYYLIRDSMCNLYQDFTADLPEIHEFDKK